MLSVLTSAAGCGQARVKPSERPGRRGSSGRRHRRRRQRRYHHERVVAGTGLNPAGTGGNVSTNPDAGACQMKDFTFEPKIPTVVLLVDRSGQACFLVPQHRAVESVRGDKDHRLAWTRCQGSGILPGSCSRCRADVRFGFTAFNGVSGPRLCPRSRRWAPALNNYMRSSRPLQLAAVPDPERQVGDADPAVPGGDGRRADGDHRSR